MPEPLSDAELAELERLDREATAGEWKWNGRDANSNFTVVAGKHRFQICSCYGAFGELVANGKFIAAARNALPRLLAELRALRHRVAELEQERRSEP